MTATDCNRDLTVNVVPPIRGLVNWLGAADQAEDQYTFDDPTNCSSITMHHLDAVWTNRYREISGIA